MIKVFEIWTPTGRVKEPVLELSASYYGDLESFKLASTNVTFAPGVGLPGRVWASKRPILIEDLSDQTRFVRAAAAVAAGLSVGLGIPLLDGDSVRAVVTLLCTGGVIEIWSPNADGTALTLRAGSYSNAAAFGAVSQGMSFASGEGLPGKVWATRAPLIFKDLATSATFSRKEAAHAAGLTVGLGIPIFHGDTVVDVVLLLSSQTLPFSKVFEIWSPNADKYELELNAGYYGELAAFGEVSKVTTFAQGTGLPGRVWAAQAPVILRALADPAEFLRAEAAALAGLVAGLGLPVLADGEIKATIIILS
jgi:hypothetical protein